MCLRACVSLSQKIWTTLTCMFPHTHTQYVMERSIRHTSYLQLKRKAGSRQKAQHHCRHSVRGNVSVNNKINMMKLKYFVPHSFTFTGPCLQMIDLLVDRLEFEIYFGCDGSCVHGRLCGRIVSNRCVIYCWKWKCWPTKDRKKKNW